ncbi:MAG: M67 family metallopeptidase [Proteobacteria bacterium]|nr:M67 family metallopeptidase [Pseudomonadota bacterium]
MIVFDPSDLKTVVEAAETGYPEESCGLLVGQWLGGERCQVRQIVPSVNIAADRRSSFEIDPALRLAVQRRLRGTGNRVIGLFHSHPDHSAQPSERDLERAWEPDLVWVVTSVLTGNAVLTSAHMIDQIGAQQQFREIPLHTSDWKPYLHRPAFLGPGLNAIGSAGEGHR